MLVAGLGHQRLTQSITFIRQVIKKSLKNNFFVEKEVTKLDLEISDLESQEENTEHLESFKLHGIKLLENPKECWVNGNYHERKMIFDFVFEKPLEIIEGKIGTPPICPTLWASS